MRCCLLILDLLGFSSLVSNLYPYELHQRIENWIDLVERVVKETGVVDIHRPARRRQLARISAVERHTVAAACRQQSALVLARSLSRLVNGGRFVCIGLASVIGIGVWSRGQVEMER